MEKLHTCKSATPASTERAICSDWGRENCSSLSLLSQKSIADKRGCNLHPQSILTQTAMRILPVCLSQVQMHPSVQTFWFLFTGRAADKAALWSARRFREMTSFFVPLWNFIFLNATGMTQLQRLPCFHLFQFISLSTLKAFHTRSSFFSTGEVVIVKFTWMHE